MDDAKLCEAIHQGRRRALAQVMTLTESDLPDHRAQARRVIAMLSQQGNKALRIGLSGTPGAGKSTFIDAFGCMLTAQGLKVAVLAIDPSSGRSGGSVLGDKTRMVRLSRLPNAFIRPSPGGLVLGGVARRSREMVALCEAAGFDVVLVETVGVGQSETVVAQICDIFALLLAPAGGDSLQGIKRGIMEMADFVLVNKADGDLAAFARQSCADYAGALHLLRPRVQDPPAFPCAMAISALEETGLEEVWRNMQFLYHWRQDHGHLARQRALQAQYWFQAELHQGLLAVLGQEPVRTRIDRMAQQVMAGTITPEDGAADILKDLV